ncbi:MAG TPA: cyclic nucleotide-binding domain-containing protein [Rhodocyclaceae bacterium]
MKDVTSWLLGTLMGDGDGKKATIRELAPGDSVFRLGDPGDYLAVLLVGGVEIRKGDHIISVMEPGGIFGEMGLIDGLPRIADAYAVRHSRIAEVREGQFMSLVEATPYFSIAIMRLLTERLRRQAET